MPSISSRNWGTVLAEVINLSGFYLYLITKWGNGLLFFIFQMLIWISKIVHLANFKKYTFWFLISPVSTGYWYVRNFLFFRMLFRIKFINRWGSYCYIWCDKMDKAFFSLPFWKTWIYVHKFLNLPSDCVKWKGKITKCKIVTNGWDGRVLADNTCRDCDNHWAIGRL